LGQGPYFPPLAGHLVLDVFGYVACNVSSAFSVAVDLVADEDTALLSGGVLTWGALIILCFSVTAVHCHLVVALDDKLELHIWLIINREITSVN